MICNRSLLHFSLLRFSASSPCSSFFVCLFHIYLTISHSNTTFSFFIFFILTVIHCLLTVITEHLSHISIPANKYFFLSLWVNTSFILTCLPHCSSDFQFYHVKFPYSALVYLSVLTLILISALYISFSFFFLFPPTKSSAFPWLLHKHCLTHDGCLTPTD